MTTTYQAPATPPWAIDTARRILEEGDPAFSMQFEADEQIAELAALIAKHCNPRWRVGPKAWLCSRCGCSEVQEALWVDANTGEVSPNDRPLDYFYCPACELLGVDATVHHITLWNLETDRPVDPADGVPEELPEGLKAGFTANELDELLDRQADAARLAVCGAVIPLGDESC